MMTHHYIHQHQSSTWTMMMTITKKSHGCQSWPDINKNHQHKWRHMVTGHKEYQKEKVMTTWFVIIISCLLSPFSYFNTIRTDYTSHHQLILPSSDLLSMIFYYLSPPLLFTSSHPIKSNLQNSTSSSSYNNYFIKRSNDDLNLFVVYSHLLLFSCCPQFMSGIIRSPDSFSFNSNHRHPHPAAAEQQFFYHLLLIFFLLTFWQLLPEIWEERTSDRQTYSRSTE